MNIKATKEEHIKASREYVRALAGSIEKMAEHGAPEIEEAYIIEKAGKLAGLYGYTIISPEASATIRKQLEKRAKLIKSHVLSIDPEYVDPYLRMSPDDEKIARDLAIEKINKGRKALHNINIVLEQL